MSGKQRLSASIDSDLLRAAEQAVRRGRYPSVSAWVNDGLRLKLEHDRRLDALASFVAAYEAEHGEITNSEIDAAVRNARVRARVVRGTRPVSRALPRRGPARR